MRQLSMTELLALMSENEGVLEWPPDSPHTIGFSAIEEATRMGFAKYTNGTWSTLDSARLTSAGWRQLGLQPPLSLAQKIAGVLMKPVRG